MHKNASLHSPEGGSGSVESKTSLRQKNVTPDAVALPDRRQGSAKHCPVELQTSAGGPDMMATPMYGSSHDLEGGGADGAERRILDGFLLLESTGMGFPNDARIANLAGKQLAGVVEEDLEFFTGLLFLDVSENAIPLQSFAPLPRLKELRMVCCNMTSIPSLVPNASTTHSVTVMELQNYGGLAPDLTVDQIRQLGCGFQRLQYLDLSYNRLTVDSIQSLYIMTALRELDLTGNNLGNIPGDVYRFPALEKLYLSRNRIQDNTVFISAGSIPNLRHLNVSYNYLSSIPTEAVQGAYGDQYRVLDSLDLSFNYFGQDEDINPANYMPRLSSAIIYGNPILGPTGEDVLKMYVEEFVQNSLDIRDSNSWGDVEWITEIPKKRNSTGGFRKGEQVGRLAVYRNVNIVAIETNDEKENLSAEEWRKQGRKTLFGEAVAAAKGKGAKKVDGGPAIPDSTNTFITSGGNNFYGGGGDSGGLDTVANNVMEEVAKSMNISTTVELLSLKQKAQLPKSYLSTKKLLVPNENVPVDSLMYPRSMGQPSTVQSGMRSQGTHGGSLSSSCQPDSTLGMTAAIRSLRYALEHPMTNYNEVPAKGFLPPVDYVRPTVSSTMAKLPRIAQAGANAVKGGGTQAAAASTGHGHGHGHKSSGSGKGGTHAAPSSAGGTATRKPGSAPSAPGASGSAVSGAASTGVSFTATDAIQSVLHPHLSTLAVADKMHGATQLHVGGEDYTSPQHHKKKYVSFKEKYANEEANSSTLGHIEEVLDSLNFSTADMLQSVRRINTGGNGGGAGGAAGAGAGGRGGTGGGGGGGASMSLQEERMLMKRFARPTGQVQGMISVINSVAADLEVGGPGAGGV